MQPTKLTCPKCHRKFEVESRPLKVIAKKCGSPEDQEKKPQLSDADRAHLQDLVGLGAGHALTQAAVAATPRLFQHSQPFKCPWCQTQLTVMTMVILANAVQSGSIQVSSGRTRIPTADRLEDRTVGSTLNASGINLALNAFGEAVREQARLKSQGSGGVVGIPRDMLRFFDKFIRFASSRKVTHSILTQMQRQHPNDTFRVWQAEGVALVTKNDELFRFLPAILLEREPPPPVIEHEVVKLPTTDWVKSKHGYIPAGSRLFLGELRRKSKGAFSRPTQ